MTQRIITLAVIVTIVLGGGYYAFQSLFPPPDRDALGPLYATAPVVRGDIYVGVDARGSLDPAAGGGIQAPGGGGYGPYGPIPSVGPSSYTITEVLVKEGQSVKEGDVLVRLSPTELREMIRSKEDRLRADREALARMMGVSPDRLDTIDASRGITLRAHIGGRVTGLSVREGQELKRGQVVARLVDDSRFRMTAKLTPLEVSNVSVGTRVLIHFSQFDSYVSGRVTHVSPDPIPEDSSTLRDIYGGQTEYSSGHFQFVYWVTIEGPNGGLIRPGMLGMVALPASQEPSGSAPFEELGARFRYYAQVDGFADEEMVLSGVDAIATRVYVHEMQKVKAGDRLVSLTGEDAQRMVTDMLDKVRQQEAEHRQLLMLLDGLDIKATMDGVIAHIDARPGQTVQPGQWFGHVFNTADMRMYVQVDDVDVLMVQQGAQVQVTVPAVPGQIFEGVVEYVGMMGKDESGFTRYQVNIRVKGGADLRPGMQANAHIFGGRAEGVLLIPLEAIFEEDGRPKVEILLPDGRPQVVAIQLGLMDHRRAEVTAGLEEGQLVITGSTADLLPSQRIQSGTLLPGGGGSPGDGDGGNGGDGGK